MAGDAAIEEPYGRCADPDLNRPGDQAWATAGTVLALRLQDREQDYQQRIALLDAALARAKAAGAAADDQVPLTLGLVQAVVAEIHANGFAVVPQLIGAQQLDRIRVAAEPLFAASRAMFARLDPAQPRQTIHIQNVLAKSRAADEIAVNPILRAIVAGVLRPDFLLNAGAIAMSPDPGCSAQGLHRDDGCYSALPRPRPPLVLTAALALDDFTEDNGATRVVPGSCAWPGSREPTADEVRSCVMPAGSVLVYDGAIFHGGGANTTSDQTRRTLTLNYTRGWLRTQFNQYLSVPRSEVLNLPPELRRDLGYQLSEDRLGGCDNQDPLAYLVRMSSAGGDGSQALLGREVDEALAIDECTAARSTGRGQ